MTFSREEIEKRLNKGAEPQFFILMVLLDIRDRLDSLNARVDGIETDVDRIERNVEAIEGGVNPR